MKDLFEKVQYLASEMIALFCPNNAEHIQTPRREAGGGLGISAPSGQVDLQSNLTYLS